MKKEITYDLIVKITVTPKDFILENDDAILMIIHRSLKLGMYTLEQTADQLGLHVINSTHHYEAKES